MRCSCEIPEDETPDAIRPSESILRIVVEHHKRGNPTGPSFLLAEMGESLSAHGLGTTEQMHRLLVAHERKGYLKSRDVFSHGKWVKSFEPTPLGILHSHLMEQERESPELESRLHQWFKDHQRNEAHVQRNSVSTISETTLDSGADGMDC